VSNLIKENLKVKKNYLLNKFKKCTSFWLILLFLMSLKFGNAQSENAEDSKWSKAGKINVLLNQATFSEWLGGGTNNFNGIVNLDYKVQHKKNEWDWTTILDASVGFAKTESSDFYKKTVDHLELNSVLLRVSDQPWGFSASFNLKSQWIAGYAFSEGANGEEIRTPTTAFLSPLYARVGVGVTYKKTRSFSFQIQPVTARLIYVGSRFTRDLIPVETYFGVMANKQSRWELALSMSAQGKWPLLPNVILLNKLNLISNYLEEFKNFDFDYSLGVEMKINNFMSAQFEIQLVYDDNALTKIQTRQVFGVGIGFSF
tara:strand:- start:634 stop:1578 length:945 start_codon:yes stop_codon:yes gene_type:complete